MKKYRQGHICCELQLRRAEETEAAVSKYAEKYILFFNVFNLLHNFLLFIK